MQDSRARILGATRNVNYRHAFHAGNFGDVLKHIVLVALLERMTQKAKPLFFLDTHAGRGRYDLDAPAVARSREADRGIRRLSAAPDLPPLARRYVELVRDFDAANSSRIRFYPGSPRFAARLLRDTDRAALCELEAGEAEALRREFADDERFSVHRRDGYEALKGLLPPAERRGLVLVDPPYETRQEELRKVTDALVAAYGRWPQGVYVAWYPIKRAAPIGAMHRSLVARGLPSLLAVELSIHPEDNDAGMNGSGMLLVNPPWRIEEELAGTLPVVHAALAGQGAGGTRIERLAGA